MLREGEGEGEENKVEGSSSLFYSLTSHRRCGVCYRARLGRCVRLVCDEVKGRELFSRRVSRGYEPTRTSRTTSRDRGPDQLRPPTLHAAWIIRSDDSRKYPPYQGGRIRFYRLELVFSSLWSGCVCSFLMLFFVFLPKT